VQEALRHEVITAPLDMRPRTVAGVDASFSGKRVIAAACLFTWPEMELAETSHAVMPLTFPYVPGYLSFREGPAVIRAIESLGTKPDIIIFDGHGTAHPAGVGIACHIGVILDIPSVGCAKSRLIGTYSEPGERKGSWSYLMHRGSAPGAVVRTRQGVKPVFVSPGHRIDLHDSIMMVLSCTGRFRLPEPLRCADQECRALRMSAGTP